MKRILGLLAAIMMPAGVSLAATVINNGAEAVVLVVTENGSRMDVAVDAGASENICMAGCFLTLPNGDRIALSGNETVELDGAAAAIK